MFCDDEVSAVSVASAITCEACPATTSGSFRLCATGSALPRGKELPPSIRAHPKQGREALNLLDLAVAAVAEFEKTVEYGFFTVHFTSEERASDLAKHARTLIETATATPKTDLWLSDAFDTIGREYIDLPAFFTQKRRGKRFFKKVLKQFKQKLDHLRSFCLRELAAADAKCEQTVLRQVVTELDPFSL